MFLDLLSSGLHSVKTVSMGSGTLFAEGQKVTGTGPKYCVGRANTRRPNNIINKLDFHTQHKVAIEFRNFSFKLVLSEFQRNMGALNDAHLPRLLNWNRLKFDTVHSARGLNNGSVEVSTLIDLKNIKRPKIDVNPTKLGSIPELWGARILERRREACRVKTRGMVDNMY
jgi:hypothetical protein